jgi:DNA-binding beta-propeller fold protein YncE
VSVVDPTTARVLKTIPVGVGPMNAVVDARASQVLVLNDGNPLRNIYATGSMSVLRLR